MACPLRGRSPLVSLQSMTQKLPSAARVASRLKYPHRLALAVLQRPDTQWASGVLDPSNGEVFAWDGWDSADGVPSAATRSVDSYDWDDCDDDPSKLLVDTNGAWLGPLASHIWQHGYSLDSYAASLLEGSDLPNPDDAPHPLREVTVVAYYPLDIARVTDAVERAAARGTQLGYASVGDFYSSLLTQLRTLSGTPSGTPAVL